MANRVHNFFRRIPIIGAYLASKENRDYDVSCFYCSSAISSGLNQEVGRVLEKYYKEHPEKKSEKPTRQLIERLLEENRNNR